MKKSTCLCLRAPPARRLLVSRVTLDTGANVSTMIFCEVSFKFEQSIDLNILRARFIS